MKANLFRSILKYLEPLLKKYFGEILYRLKARNSPFFQPIISVGVGVSVLSAFLAATKNVLIENGFPLPGWFTLAVAMVGSASAAFAILGSLTINSSEAKKLASQ